LSLSYEELENLTYEELLEEIKREESEQEDRRSLLTSILLRREEILKSIQDERLKKPEERAKARREKLEQLRRTLVEWNRQIARTNESLKRLERRVEELENLLAYHEARLLTWFISTFERAYTRDRIRAIRRSISAYRGHITRRSRLLEHLRHSRATTIAEIASHTRWLRREDTLLERIKTLESLLDYWIGRARSITEEIESEAKRLEFKYSLILLRRVSVALYLIIEGGEHYYPRDGGYYTYYNPAKGKLRHVRQKVKYPKGRFQAIVECDAFADPRTGQIKTDTDPFLTLEPIIRQDVAEELSEEFNMSIPPETLTLGVASPIPREEELGKPPFKVSISRTDEETGKEWKFRVETYLMSDEEYEALTRGMKAYRERLRRPRYV